MLELIRWRICLLIIPISDFDGFISLHVGLFEKLGLWSLRVMKESFVASESTRLSMPRLFAIFFSSDIILLVACVGAFL